MPARRIILVALALLVGLGTYMVTRSAPPAPPPAEVKVTQILAAVHDLPTGSILKESDMKWIPWASTAETGKLYVQGTTDMSSLVGAVLREGLRADEPFIAGRVVQPHEQGFLAAVLTPGMRAVSVTLTPSAEVAGFIFPGDRVDVLLTQTFSRKDMSDLSERHVSQTVIVDARVLALDQKSDSQNAEPKIAATATLEVTPKQAEKLALAADLAGTGGGHGALSLALRSLATEEGAAPMTPASAGPTWDSDVSPAYPAVNGDDGLTQRVEIMRGKDKTETIFERRNERTTP